MKDVLRPSQDSFSPAYPHPQTSSHDSEKAGDPTWDEQSADRAQPLAIYLCPDPSPLLLVPMLVVAGVSSEPELRPAESARWTREKTEQSYDSVCEVCSVDVGSGRHCSARWAFQDARMEVENGWN